MSLPHAGLQPSSHNSTQHCERTRSECLINDVKSTTEENNSWSVASSLSQKKVSSLALSITGVLLHEKSAAELSNKGATPIESSIEVLRELITRLNKKVFLVCEVEDDVGEAVVLDCLDHAGLLGDTMIPRHRIIFCSSNKSKVSIVRQIEPSLYVDVDEEVCQELSRFMNLILVLGENATLEEKLSSL